MMTGEFSTVVIDQIIINRGERIRQEVSNDAVVTLAESINRLGLIHPIVLTRGYELVAGETRLRACEALGWTQVPFQFADTLEPDELLALELEENVKRRDLSWQDNCRAVLRLHELKVRTHNSWRTDDTAKAIGYAGTQTRNMLLVARELDAGNARVDGASKFTVARGIVTRELERRSADETAMLTGEADKPEAASPILVADFNEWAPRYDGVPFNLIHCDFPYGIRHDTFAQGAGEKLGTYEDTEATYWTLLDTLIDNRDRLMGESAHLIFWFSMRFYAQTLVRLQDAFWIDPYPLVWHKSDNRGTLPDPTRGPRRIYEVAFFCSHGDRKIISTVGNVFAGPVERVAGHPSEKSPAMLSHFFRMVVDGKTRLLDPACGSGGALRAALGMGASEVLGLEIDPAFAADARRVLGDG